MKFGLTEKEYQFVTDMITPLKKEGVTIWCFGSRARGNHQPFSDLDLMVEAEVDLTREIGAINEKIIESNFPYKVDIVQKKDFADSYMAGFITDRRLF